MALNELSELTGLEDKFSSRDNDLPNAFSSKSFQIDFENGRILSNLLPSSETVSQQVGIELMTERGVHVVFGDDFGIEVQDIIHRALTPEMTIAEVEEEIRDALSADPRINDISSIEAVAVGGDKVQIHIELEVGGNLLSVTQEI